MFSACWNMNFGLKTETSAVTWVSRLLAHPRDSGFASLHSQMSQFLKISLSLSLCLSVSLSLENPEWYMINRAFLDLQEFVSSSPKMPTHSVSMCLSRLTSCFSVRPFASRNSPYGYSCPKLVKKLRKSCCPFLVIWFVFWCLVLVFKQSYFLKSLFCKWVFVITST